MTKLPTEDMSLPGRYVHVATKRGTIAKWVSFHGLVNTALILVLFAWVIVLSAPNSDDGEGSRGAVETLFLLIDGLAARTPLLVGLITSLGAAFGTVYVAWKKHAHNERVSDR